MNPKLTINLDQLKHNASKIALLCQSAGVTVSAVTKGFCAMPRVAEAIIAGGIKSLADSRVNNLRRLCTLEAEKLMLRIPMLSEVEMVVHYADLSLNSEWDTIRALDFAAGKQNRVHGIILMFDLGDLREGVFNREELIELAKKTSMLDNVSLKGIGANLTCFGAIIPDEQNLGQLVSLAEETARTIGHDLEIISGGNSSSIYLLQEGRLPSGINHLRIGEAILSGTESAFGRRLPDMYHYCFQLTAELVEVRKKPSLPIGTVGKDAFDQVPHFVDRGIRKRAIAAVGKQDFANHNLKPLNQGIEILGSSSDHLILDITDAERDLRVGDELAFALSYGAMLALSTSDYVSTRFIGGAC